MLVRRPPHEHEFRIVGGGKWQVRRDLSHRA